MESKSKKLRSGYTTGACAAAAAKAAMVLLLRNAEPAASVYECEPRECRLCGMRNESKTDLVEIPFPDGSRVGFKINKSGFRKQESTAYASIIKDAGDDPDVTHGAEIVAEVSLSAECGMRSAEWVSPEIMIKGGIGVGRVTKPGLAIPVGEAAINPVPRKMIREAVMDAISECSLITPHSAFRTPHLQVTISVPAGEELAKKTLNHRLGIVGGISILGTTGIVRPISTEAYTASITAAMDVAKAMGRDVVVLSSGRTSEKAHMKKFGFPEEAYVMMGDYLEFSLMEAKKHSFSTIHLCAQWAKMIKTAMSTPQTHVRHGAITGSEAAVFLRDLGIDVPAEREFNTARELFEYINSALRTPHSPLRSVCAAAKQYAELITSGIPVTVHLISYEGEVLAESD